MRTNDIVLLSLVEAVLGDAGIAHVVLDAHTSSIEGSIGAIPRRILVDADEAERARRLVDEARGGGTDDGGQGTPPAP